MSGAVKAADKANRRPNLGLLWLFLHPVAFLQPDFSLRDMECKVGGARD